MPDDKWSAAENWVWEKICAGQIADFNEKFVELDPRKPDGWNNDRKISAGFLRRIFFEKPYQGDIPIEGARIIGAFLPEGQVLRSGCVNRDVQLLQSRSEKSIDLQFTTFEGVLSLAGSWVAQPTDAATVDLSGAHIGKFLDFRSATFKGDVRLVAAKVDGPLSMDGSTFEATLNGNSLHVGQYMGMCKATFRGDVSLLRAKIDGALAMDASTFEPILNGEGVQVGQDLLMREATFKGNVSFVNAKIGGQISMDGSNFEATLNGSGLHVDQYLVMRKATFRGNVSLLRAKIDGAFSTEGSSFEATLDANSLQVGQAVFMREATFKGNVSLTAAKIDGQLSMGGSTFKAALNCESVQVGQHLLMSNAVFKSPVPLLFAHVGGNLDMRGATLAGLDLTGASVTQDLRLAGGEATAVWSRPDLGRPFLKLRNTQVGALQDSLLAWPSVIDLEGFSYSHLGGFGAEGTDDARIRPVKAWRSWLAKDGGPNRGYSPQPYAQLASVLVAAGRRDYANAVLFAGRQRERKQAFRERRLGRWLWLTALRSLCGYGIGIRTFYVVPWIILSVALGTWVLWHYAPIASHPKGPLWCVGASLDRLLPIIQLNKEFADFFNDPGRTRLTDGVIAFFAALGLWGWIPPSPA
jgi:hypothetical protein